MDTSNSDRYRTMDSQYERLEETVESLLPLMFEENNERFDSIGQLDRDEMVRRYRMQGLRRGRPQLRVINNSSPVENSHFTPGLDGSHNRLQHSESIRSKPCAGSHRTDDFDDFSILLDDDGEHHVWGSHGQKSVRSPMIVHSDSSRGRQTSNVSQHDSRSVSPDDTTTTQRTSQERQVHFVPGEKDDASYDYEHLRLIRSRRNTRTASSLTTSHELVLRSDSNIHHPTIALMDHSESPHAFTPNCFREIELYWQNPHFRLAEQRPDLAEELAIKCKHGHVMDRVHLRLKRWFRAHILRHKPIPIPTPTTVRFLVE